MCTKGMSITQLAYHPDRIIYPMKKVGEKLSGKWERITWDEALDTIATKFKAIVKEFGPEHILVGQGTGRDYESHLYRFANLAGDPQCPDCRAYVLRLKGLHEPDHRAAIFPVVDYYVNEPKLIVMWASNPMWTNPDEYKGENFYGPSRMGPS